MSTRRLSFTSFRHGGGSAFRHAGGLRVAAFRNPSVQTLITLLVVGGAAAFVLWHLRPDLIIRDNTPAGGDMGAHVWGPAYLRDHLLPHGRLTGWAPDWYAGFPALTFYFPLPSLAIVLLDVVLPYGVAFKVITVLGLVGLPVAAYTFGRLVGMPFPGPAVLSVAVVPFLFDRHHEIWGGNIPSAMAGEFAFAIGLSLALVYLGVLAKGLETGRHRALTAVLLAVCGLCHMIPTFFALAGTLVLLVMRWDRRRLAYVVTIGAVAGALAAFWIVPFVVRNPFTTNMGWERTTAYLENLFPFLRKATDSQPARYASHMRLVSFLALAGAVVGCMLRRRVAVAVTALAAISALAFRLIPEGPLWNVRVLPFWYLCLYLLAGIAVVETGRAIALLVTRDPRGTRGTHDESAPRRPATVVSYVTPVVAAVAILYMVSLPLHRMPSWLPGEGGNVATRDASYIPSWVKWNYTGYEGKEAWGEYKGIVDTMGRLPCGRAMWEYAPDLDRYGTPMALMLLPYWTKGCIASMEGLFFEAAATTPYHFLNQSELSLTPSRAMRDLPYRSLNVDAGVKHLQMLGVRYYMAFSAEATAQADVHPDLRLVATSPRQPPGLAGQVAPWKVYEVARSDAVVGLRHLPAVIDGIDDGRQDWLAVATRFYQDRSSGDVPLAAEGPKGWPRAQVDRAEVAVPLNGAVQPLVGDDLQLEPPDRVPVDPVNVSRIEVGDDRISFDVDRVGTPVVVKSSYFPNWKASGAKGPWRITPNLMVVVPTARHVSLHYGWTPVDLFGIVLSLAGVAGVVVLARRRWARFPDRSEEPGDGDGAPEAGPAQVVPPPERDLAPV